MFATIRRASSSRRPLAFAGGVALAALLVVPSGALAAAQATASVSGDTLSASVTGTPRAGRWRIRVVAPNGRERIDFVLRTGDITWNGAVRVSRLTDGRWTLVSKRLLSGTHDALQRATGSAAGVKWDTTRFRLPHDGNSRFAVNVELTRSGSYKMVAFVRTAHEAFSYGPWTRVDSRAISH